MSYSSSEEITSAGRSSSSNPTDQQKYKGVRRRKWGKWVSEIRVPGSNERLWLGSYSSPEGAAIAHDVAYYCLRRPATSENLNFPLMLPRSVDAEMSPGSIQKVASDAGMAVDAQYLTRKSSVDPDHRMVSSKAGDGSPDAGETRSVSWEHLDDGCNRTWVGSSDSRGTTRELASHLSISIEDYL